MKILLKASVFFCVFVSTYPMNKRSADFLLSYPDDCVYLKVCFHQDGKNKIFISQMPAQVGASIPFIKEEMKRKKAFIIFKNADNKDVVNFKTYACNRFALQRKNSFASIGNNTKIDDKSGKVFLSYRGYISDAQRKFLNSLSIHELIRLTKRISEMYQEDVPLECISAFKNRSCIDVVGCRFYYKKVIKAHHKEFSLKMKCIEDHQNVQTVARGKIYPQELKEKKECHENMITMAIAMYIFFIFQYFIA